MAAGELRELAPEARDAGEHDAGAKDDGFRGAAGGERDAGPAAPDEQRRREEEDPHRVAEPPDEPDVAEGVPRLEAARAQAGRSHRGRDGGAEAGGEAEQAHHVPYAVEALVHLHAAEEPCPRERLQRVSGGDRGRRGPPLVGEDVGGKGTQPYARPHAEAEDEQDSQRDPGRGPHDRDLLGHDREAQAEASGAEIQDGDGRDERRSDPGARASEENAHAERGA